MKWCGQVSEVRLFCFSVSSHHLWHNTQTPVRSDCKKLPFTSPTHSLQETERRRKRCDTSSRGQWLSTCVCVCVWFRIGRVKVWVMAALRLWERRKHKFISFSTCWTLYTCVSTPRLNLTRALSSLTDKQDIRKIYELQVQLFFGFYF